MSAFAVDQAVVDLVGDDGHTLAHSFNQFLNPIGGSYRSRGVGGRIEHQSPRLWRDMLRGCPRIPLKAVLLAHRHANGNSVERRGEVRIARIMRISQQHL